jgi:hypothetical protein
MHIITGDGSGNGETASCVVLCDLLPYAPVYPIILRQALNLKP